MDHQMNKKKMTLFAITWPIFIELLLHMLMGNIDTLMLSQYSDDSVASVGVANQILSLFIVIFGFVATGTAVLVAQHLGAKQQKEAMDVSAVSLLANLAVGLMISAGLFIFSGHLLKMMDLPNRLLAEGNQYLKLVGLFIFLEGLIMTAGAILRSSGFTKDSMYVTVAMNILNIVGNYCFIFGPFAIPVLGVQGVAISTVASRMIGLLLIGYALVHRLSFHKHWTNFSKNSFRHLKHLMRIGIPTAGEHLSYNGSQMVLTYFAATLGAEALTTKVYAQNLMMLIFLFSAAISQGTQILVGHFIGAKQFEAAYKRCMRTLSIAVVISTLGAVLFFAFSDALFGLFTNNPSIIAEGKHLLLLTIILEPGRAFNMVIISSLIASSDAKFPVYMAIISMWGVGISVAYIFTILLGWGLAGIWISFIVDEWLRGILMLFRWKSRIWVKKSFIHQQATNEVSFTS